MSAHVETFKPVDQTKFGPDHGNCLMACVASLLGVPLDSLPVLGPEHDENFQWWYILQDTFRKHGFDCFSTFNNPQLAPRGYAIASGQSPRNLPHAVIGLDGKIVHDPHPSRDGLIEIDRWYITVPLLPSSPTTEPGK